MNNAIHQLYASLQCSTAITRQHVGVRIPLHSMIDEAHSLTSSTFKMYCAMRYGIIAQTGNLWARFIALGVRQHNYIIAAHYISITISVILCSIT